jgi:hypothetical protein
VEGLATKVDPAQASSQFSDAVRWLATALRKEAEGHFIACQVRMTGWWIQTSYRVPAWRARARQLLCMPHQEPCVAHQLSVRVTAHRGVVGGSIRQQSYHGPIC